MEHTNIAAIYHSVLVHMMVFKVLSGAFSLTSACSISRIPCSLLFSLLFQLGLSHPCLRRSQRRSELSLQESLLSYFRRSDRSDCSCSCHTWCRHRKSPAHKAHSTPTTEDGPLDEVELAVVESSILVDLYRKNTNGGESVELASSHSDEASAAPSEVDCFGSDNSVQVRASVQKSLRGPDHVHYPIHLTVSRVQSRGLVVVQL